MRTRILYFIISVPLFCSHLWAQERETINFIYCSDVHYGLEREFRGSWTSADSVCRAMIESFRILETTILPEDGGVDEGEIFGKPDFVICTGDIANRMEDGVQPASESWKQFCKDWSSYCTTDPESYITLLKGEMNGPHCGIPLFLVPGNHDISNAIGYTKPMHPKTDPASASGIFNLMMLLSQAHDDGDEFHDSLLKTGDKPNPDFRYAKDKTHYSFVLDSIRFVFMGMWPDSEMREWFAMETAEDDGIPALIFTHDPPEADAKHFTNPWKGHGINGIDKFENLLSDTCSVRYIDRKPKRNWEVLEKFIYRHPEIKAYFHGDKNYNEFYSWTGVEGSINLPVFRVDSPMKGEYSSYDESLLSFIVVSIDPSTGMLTARECLWNKRKEAGLSWGETRTICL